MTDSNYISPMITSRNEPSEFQIAILGSAGVGKSALVRRYTKNTFTEDYTPTFIDNINFRFQLANHYGELSRLGSLRDHRSFRE
jgi:GTPase SAR1 family protein